MHFSIPDLQQFRDDNGLTYTGFNIHIDGFYHCTARFKQMLSLHEQLQSQYSYFKLPQFPPKKFFLTSSQLEERRILLEKYIQLIGQNPVLANSGILMTFLLTAQQESHNVKVHVVDIEISLMNGYRIPLSVSSTDTSSTVLDIACNYVNLPKDLTKYFSLFLFNWSCAKDGQPSFKKLEDFESPYISQKYVRPEDKIVLRKSYWDPCYDMDLVQDRVSIDLLYLQIIEDIDLGWITADSETKVMLSSLESKKQKREYIELARSLRHYGRIPAGEGLTEAVNIGDMGGALINVRVSLACKELSLTSVTHPSHEQRYKVTRMRCWRITTLHSSIVDELMRQKNGEGPISPRCKRASLTYLRRDGSSQLITPSSSSDTLSSINGDSCTSGSSREIFSVQKLTEKFASVAFKTGKDCVENNAFEAIGDEEL
ncbi:sorting nexin-17 isoform X2 [Pieris napi]|uniref:sorting nexin-17 isoform X2 n=1 Tax=Pieris napi TaxID=78633 RepID=UPI001FBA81CF|nr:sorting nexin-17 isoform X2 [Pieris napi]